MGVQNWVVDLLKRDLVCSSIRLLQSPVKISLTEDWIYSIWGKTASGVHLQNGNTSLNLVDNLEVLMVKQGDSSPLQFMIDGRRFHNPTILLCF